MADLVTAENAEPNDGRTDEPSRRRELAVEVVARTAALWLVVCPGWSQRPRCSWPSLPCSVGLRSSTLPETSYGTSAIAHGQVACAYPPVSLPDFPPAAPLYLLLSGGIAAITRIGQPSAFPSAAVLEPNSHNAFPAMSTWSNHAGASGPTEWIGCVGWLALMIGAVAWLRAAGRGRCGWEPATLIVLACLPPVWMCVQSYFHPQDLLAMEYALSAMACARRGRWVGAGILVLAVLSQQFTLLVAAPLLLLAPATRRVSYVAAALTTAALVVLPLGILTSGHAWRSITFGTGAFPVPSGAVLSDTAQRRLVRTADPGRADRDLDRAAWWVADASAPTRSGQPR